MRASSPARLCRSTAASTCIDGAAERREAGAQRRLSSAKRRRNPADGRAQREPIGGADFLLAGCKGMPMIAYHPPVKRSVTIAGHETSISLEPIFWSALEKAANDLQLPINALVARVDAERIEGPAPPNLTSALRQWLFDRGSDG
jgi:predicted DNA-binding ribbon-helix-helix protein